MWVCSLWRQVVLCAKYPGAGRSGVCVCYVLLVALKIPEHPLEEFLHPIWWVHGWRNDRCGGCLGGRTIRRYTYVGLTVCGRSACKLRPAWLVQQPTSVSATAWRGDRLLVLRGIQAYWLWTSVYRTVKRERERERERERRQRGREREKERGGSRQRQREGEKGCVQGEGGVIWVVIPPRYTVFLAVYRWVQNCEKGLTNGKREREKVKGRQKGETDTERQTEGGREGGRETEGGGIEEGRGSKRRGKREVERERGR